MRVKTIEQWILFGVGAVVIVDGITLASTWKERMRALESGGYEILLGVLLIGLTALYRLRQPGVEWPGGPGARLVAIGFGILAGYALLMPHLGYMLSTFLVVAAYMRTFGKYRWTTTLAFSAAFAVGTAWIWAKLIIILPNGIVPWPTV